MLMSNFSIDEVSVRGLLVGFVALVFSWTITKSIVVFIASLIRPDSTPFVGSRFTIKDLVQDVGLNNETRRELEEGYYKYSKKGKPFWLSNFPLKPDLVLPPSEVRRLMKEPDSVLSVSANLNQNFATDYTMPFLAHPTHENVISKYLTKRLRELTPDIMDEVEAALEDLWGTDTENFKEVPILASVEKILARSDNRVFVGLPLCRSDEYLKMTVKFAEDVAVNGMLINLLPRVLKPVLGRILTITNRLHYYKARKHLMPHIEKRLAAYNDSEKESSHNDFITWIIEDATKHGDAAGLDPQVISFRIIDVNFAAIHTSSFTSTNALLDIFSCPSRDGLNVPETLREEIMRVYTEEQGQWTKAGLERLVRIDSAIRESMRHTGIFYRGTMRKVVDPNGFQATPDIRLPAGMNVGTSAYSIHHDEEFYHNPHQYNPFRFSAPREDAAALESQVADGDSKSYLEGAVAKDKTSSLNQTTETFLGWGHGRKACPGRYFATDVMRLMIAAMLKDYEIQTLDPRPNNKWMLNTVMPPADAKLKVRRRKQ